MRQATAARPGSELERVLEYLAQQARAILERATVFIGARVEAPREERLKRRQRVAGVHVHEVVAGLQRALHPLSMPATQIGDVAQRHRTGLDRVDTLNR